MFGSSYYMKGKSKALLGRDTFPAHKMVLASHSQKLDRILIQLQPGPLSLFLAGVSSKDLSSLLSFIYSGQARVRQTVLASSRPWLWLPPYKRAVFRRKESFVSESTQS